MKILKIITLIFIFNLSISFAQEEEDPFRELEFEKEKKEEKKLTNKVKKQTKKASNIQNPKTYLSAKNYLLKGIVISSEKSFAIVGTKDTLDLVISLNEVLGKEGWKVLNIFEESIIIGDPTNKKKSTILYIVD